MKIKVIKLSEIDELLSDYNQMKHKGETFSQFIEVSGCIEEEKPKVFDWNYVEEKDLIKVEENDFGEPIEVTTKQIPKIIREILENWVEDKEEYLKELDKEDLIQHLDYYGFDEFNYVLVFLGEEPITIDEL